MAKNSTHLYKLSPAWTITQSGATLLVSGGADAQYEIELESEYATFFGKVSQGKSFKRSSLDVRDRAVLEELITAEVVVPILKKHSPLRVVILGDKFKLQLRPNDSLTIVQKFDEYDLALIVKINRTYAELLQALRYQNFSKPQLFLDIAYHHTVSVGPLVFPGETACIACLQGRVSIRWGDELPPILPKASATNLEAAQALILTELRRIAERDTSLTNATISWNFQKRSVSKNQLLKVPLCPVCTKNVIDQPGALALPW